MWPHLREFPHAAPPSLRSCSKTPRVLPLFDVINYPVHRRKQTFSPHPWPHTFGLSISLYIQHSHDVTPRRDTEASPWVSSSQSQDFSRFVSIFFLFYHHRSYLNIYPHLQASKRIPEWDWRNQPNRANLPNLADFF